MSLLPPLQTFDEFEAETAPMLVKPFETKFGAVPWRDIDAPGPTYEYLIKGLLARGEVSMIAGPSQSGKSFVAIDLAMAIARGVDWMGRKVRRGGVVYQAGESAKGVRRRRLPAYRRFHGLDDEADIPFVMLSRPIDLHGSDDQTNDLIAEAKHWASTFDVPLELVIIDTFSAATPGADENSGQDVSRILARCQRIAAATNAAVLVVHHMNSDGNKPRGHTSILANLDTVLVTKKTADMRDEDGRPIREISLAKSKDGDADVSPFRFVLASVEIGRDEDGEAITSCVVQMPRKADEEKKPKFRLTDGEQWFLRALYDAVDEFGGAPPTSLSLPRSITRVVAYEKVKEVIARQNPDDGDDPKAHAEKIKKRVQRAREGLTRARLIGVLAPYIWPTTRGQDSAEPAGPASEDPLDGWGG